LVVVVVFAASGTMVVVGFLRNVAVKWNIVLTSLIMNPVAMEPSETNSWTKATPTVNAGAAVPFSGTPNVNLTGTGAAPE
jgi:hypothetical protein